jgi:hypothetical protein
VLQCKPAARQIVPDNSRLRLVLPVMRTGCYPPLSHKKNNRGSRRQQPPVLI